MQSRCCQGLYWIQVADQVQIWWKVQGEAQWGTSGKQEVRKGAFFWGVGGLQGEGGSVLQLGCSNSSAEG